MNDALAGDYNAMEIGDTVDCPIRRMASESPNHPAILTEDRVISYDELDRLVAYVASRLVDLGTVPGISVAAHLEDDWRYPVLLWAVLRTRGVLVPLNRREPPNRLEELSDRAGAAIRVSYTEESGLRDAWIPWASLAPPSGSSGGSVEIDEPVKLSLSSRATIMFTSGSTAASKAVVHTLGSHWYSALGSQSTIPVQPETMWLAVLPFYHVGGLSILFRCFLHGGTVVIGDRRNPGGSLSRAPTTYVSLVPTQLLRMLDADQGKLLARLRGVLVGGAHVPSVLIRRALDSGIKLRTSYGSTEMASQIATTAEGGGANDLATSGRVLPYREVKIGDDGEIMVRGKTLFSGYLYKSDLILPVDSEGWFAMGDLGQFDGSGRLVVFGRKDAMFVSGGENIYPEEIEEALLNTGLVSDACVVPTVDAEFGARPVAFVAPFIDPDQLVSALRLELPAYKVPVNVLPMPAEYIGVKPDRTRLAALAAV